MLPGAPWTVVDGDVLLKWWDFHGGNGGNGGNVALWSSMWGIQVQQCPFKVNIWRGRWLVDHLSSPVVGVKPSPVLINQPMGKGDLCHSDHGVFSISAANDCLGEINQPGFINPGLTLSGWWSTYPSEKDEFVSRDFYSQLNGKKKTSCSKPPTSVISYHYCYLWAYSSWFRLIQWFLFLVIDVTCILSMKIAGS